MPHDAGSPEGGVRSLNARSLNVRWRQDDFYARVAGLAAVRDGGRILDLGCGRGLTCWPGPEPPARWSRWTA
jgi:2-polyprenyl-3-methyl-5-hydroxy-6-metoxy-1,4-benzoquinol methylase